MRRCGAVGLLLAWLPITVGATPIRQGLELLADRSVPGSKVHAIADLDGNGRDELVVSVGLSAQFAVIEADDSDRGYRIRGYVSPMGLGSFNDTLVDRVRVIDIDRDGRLELAASNFTRLAVIDGPTLAVRVLSRGHLGLGDVALGDVDGDGTDELITSTQLRLTIRDPATLEQRGAIEYISKSSRPSFVVGDVTGDDRPEIILDDGVALSISRAGSAWLGMVVWNSPDGELVHLTLARRSGRKDQLVAHPAWGYVTAYRIDDGTHLPIVERAPFAVGDVDGDGNDELLAPDWIHVKAYSLLDGSVRWDLERRPAPEALGIGHFSGAESAELASCCPSTLTGLHVEPIGAGQTRTWDVLNMSGPRKRTGQFVAPDGSKRLALLTGIAVELWDAQTLREIVGSELYWAGAPPEWPLFVEQYAIAAANDPVRPHEAAVVVGAELSYLQSTYRKAMLWAVDHQARLTRTVTLPTTLLPLSARRVDVLLNGTAQIAVVGKTSTSAPTQRVMLMRASDGSIPWQSVEIPSPDGFFGHVLACRDLDGDGLPELAMIHGNGGASIFSPHASSVPVLNLPDARDLAVIDRPGDSLPELIVLRPNGQVDVHRGFAPTPSRSIDLPGDPYRMVAFAQPGLGGQRSLIVKSEYDLDVYDLDAPATLIVNVDIPANFVDLEAADIDGDGEIEVLMTGNGLRVYRLGLDTVFAHDFDPP